MCNCCEPPMEDELLAEEVRALMREWVRAKEYKDFDAFDRFLLAWLPVEHRFAHYGTDAGFYPSRAQRAG